MAIGYFILFDQDPLLGTVSQFYLIGLTNDISIPVEFTRDLQYHTHTHTPLDIQIIGGFDTASLKMEDSVRNLKNSNEIAILPNYYHSYDYMHIEKNIRNQLIQNRPIKLLNVNDLNGYLIPNKINCT
ncbi:hypothetical protein ACTA71_004004 [Dictyostelium dimigraforme]